MKMAHGILATIAAVSLGMAIPVMARGRLGNGPTPDRLNAGSSRNLRRSPLNQAGRDSVQKRVMDNPKLASEMQILLGPDINLQDAASGFTHLTRFVAAVHVAKNLSIPFKLLKEKLSSNNRDLEKSVQALRPSMTKDQVEKAVSGAMKQAAQDIKDSASNEK